MLASMFEGFDIVIIAYTAPAITEDWGLSSGELGVVLSAGLFGMTLGAMFLSWLGDRYGRRVVVSSMLLIAGLSTCAVVYTGTVTQLAVIRVVAGLALGALVANLPTLVGEYSPRRHRTLIVAVLMSGASIGAVVGGMASAAFIGDYGWQAIFLCTGAMTGILGIIIHLVVPETVSWVIKRRLEGALEKVNRTMSYIGQEPIEQLPPVGTDESRESATVVSLLAPARRATTLLIWSGFFFGFLAVYFVMSWMPQILVNAGLPQELAIQGTSVVPLGSIVGAMLIGWLAKWFKLNHLIALAFLGGALSIYLLSGLLTNTEDLPFITIWAALFLVGVTLMGGFSNLYTLALTVYPAQVRSTGIGWSAGLGRAGAVISPTLAGLMIGIGMSMPAVFLYFTAPVFAAAICIKLVKVQELP